MAKNKKPARPYHPVKHEHADSLAAFEQAATMLYEAVNVCITMRDQVTDPKAQIMIAKLEEHAGNFKRVAYGDE